MCGAGECGLVGHGGGLRVVICNCRSVSIEIKPKAQGAGGVEQVKPVAGGAGDGEGLAEAARAAGKQAWFAVGGELAQTGHGFEGRGWPERFERTDENAAGLTLWLTRHVEARVQAVDVVDIGVAGRPKEDGVARCAATEGMRRSIPRAEVGLGLDNATGKRNPLPVA